MMGFDVWEMYASFCDVMSDDNLVYIVLLISALPLSFILKYIDTPAHKQLYSLIVSGLQTVLICGIDGVIPCLMCLCSYLALTYAPRDAIGRIIFHCMFSILLVFRLLIFSGYFAPSYLTNAILLLMTLRICSYAYDYQHNTLRQSDVTEKRESAMCSLFDYVGYCFCFIGFFTGPFYTFDTYINMLYTEKRIRTSRVAWYHMRWVLFLIPFYTLQCSFIPLDYIKTEEFLDQGILWKSGYLLGVFWTFKTKFYVAWIMSEATCMACSLGVTERADGSLDVSTIINIEIINVESSSSFSGTIRAWNISVQRWMRCYVYETTKLHKSLKTFFVFGVSAFWHGVRPGYYLSFIVGPPLIAIQQKLGNLTRAVRDKNPTLELVYKLVNWCYVRWVSSLFLIPFIVLDLEKTIEIWSNMYWIGQWGLFIPFALSLCLPSGTRPEPKKES